MALVSPAMLYLHSFFFFFSSFPDYKLFLTLIHPVLLIQATSRATLSWPIAIDNVLDTISNLTAECWSTIPKMAHVLKRFHFSLHSLYAIACRCCPLDIVVHPDIFALAFS